MGSHVPIQVGHVGEAFAANLAGECALPLVNGRDVALIFVTFVKTLVAYLNQELVKVNNIFLTFPYTPWSFIT
jgi:hypothetical protein